MFFDDLRVKVPCFLSVKRPSGLESCILDRFSGPESYILGWLSRECGNHAHLVKQWEKTDSRAICASGTYGPNNMATRRIPIPCSTTTYQTLSSYTALVRRWHLPPAPTREASVPRKTCYSLCHVIDLRVRVPYTPSSVKRTIRFFSTGEPQSFDPYIPAQVFLLVGWPFSSPR